MDNGGKILKVNLMKLVAIISAIIVVIVAATIVITRNNDEKNEIEFTASKNLETKEKMSTETAVKTGTVTVSYLNEQGEEISNKMVLEGNVGDWYSVERRVIPGYTATGDEPVRRAGYYVLGNVDVKYVYKLETSAVKTKTEKEGENSSEENVVNVLFDNSRIARDYGVRIITKDEKGNVINGGIFKVGKDSEVISEGEVSNGSFYIGKIAIKNEGNIVYEVEQLKEKIEYKKINNPFEIKVNSTWNNTDKKFEISLEEQPVPGVKIYQQNEEILVEVTNEKYKDAYEIEIVNKAGSELVTGGKFKVETNGKTIIEDYVQNGILPVGEFGISSEGSQVYTITETETAKGYKTVIGIDNPGKVEVSEKFNEELGKYDIFVSYNKIEGFTAEISDNGKVTVYVETELLDDKYDLSMKKFVSNVDGEAVLEREPKVQLNEEGKLEYIQNNEIIKVCNEQEVTYSLRIYNESEETAKGKRIIEYIPDGLVFLPQNEKNIAYGWKLYKEENENLIEVTNIEEATIVATDYLVDKEIEPIEINEEKEVDINYIDAEVVFEVDEDKLTNEERIIENKVKIEKNPNDDNPENDEGIEKIYVKYFDLDVTKYIKEVKVKNNISETVEKIGIERKNELVKIDVAKSEVENTTITVTYGLLVKNIGEIEGYATELVDYIPEDFKLVEDGVWKVVKGNAVTTRLKNKLLQPGESTTIEITFDWKLTSDNIGSRINEGKITAYENPYNAKDPTEDNNDKEEMLVTVRTGEAFYYVVPVVVIAGFATAVVLIYRRKLM